MAAGVGPHGNIKEGRFDPVNTVAISSPSILDRIRTNDKTLRQLSASYSSIDVLPCEAGWSAVLRVPSTRSEEDLAIALLETAGVVVHPGFFFDFAHEAFLVVSLLPQSGVFLDGIRRVMETAHA